MAETVGAQMKTEISISTIKAVKSLKELKTMTNSLRSSWKALESTLKNQGNSAEAAEAKYKGLTKELASAEQKIKLLKQRQNELKASSSDNTAQSQKLQIQIDKASTSYNRIASQVEKAKSSMNYYKSGLAGLQKEHREVSATVASTVEKLKAEGKQSEANKAKLNGLKASVENLNKQLTIQQEELKKVESTSGKASSAYRLQMQRVNKTATAIAHASSEIKGMEARAKEGRGITGLASRMQSLKNKTDKANGTFGKFLGANLVSNAVSSGLGFIISKIGGIVSTGIAANKAMAKVSVSMENAAGGSKKLQNQLTNLYSDLKVKSGYGADAMTLLAKKTTSWANGNEKAANKLGTAFVTVGRSLGMNDGKLSQLVTRFGQLNASGSVTSASLTKMERTLPGFNAALEKSTGKSREELAKLASKGKLSMKDLQGAMITMADSKKNGLDNYYKTYDGFTTHFQQRYAKLSGLITQGIFSKNSNFLAGLSKALDGKEIETAFKNMGGAISKAMNTIFDAFTPKSSKKNSNPLAGIITSISKGIVSFANTIAKNKKQIQQFAGFLGNLAKVAVQVATAMSSMLGPVISDVMDLIASNPKVVLGAVAAFMAFVKVVTMVNKVTSAFGKILGASPLTLWITGITLVVVALVELYRHCKPFREFVNWVAGQAVKYLGVAFKFIGSTLKAVGTVFGWFSNLGITCVKAIVGAFSGVGKFIGGVFKGAAGWFGGLWKGAKSAGSKAWNGVKGAWNGTSHFFVGLWKGTTNWFGGLWRGAKSIGSKAWKAVINYFKNAGKFYVGLWKGTTKCFAGLWKGAKSMASKAWKGIVNVFKGIGKWFSNLLKHSPTWFQGIVKGVNNSMKASRRLLKIMINIFKGAFNVIGKALKVFVDLFTGKWGNLGKDLKNLTNALWRWLRNSFIQVYNWLNKITGGKLGQVLGTFGRIFKAIINTVSGAVGAVRHAMISVVRGVLTPFNTMLDGLRKGINWVITKFGMKGIKGKWEIPLPAYAKGTRGAHPGGFALVNDAKSSKYREMYKLPNGKVGLFPKQRNMVVNLPKGTQVLDGENTHRLLEAAGIPAYKGGIWDKITGFTGSLFKKGVDLVENAAQIIAHPVKFMESVIKKFMSSKLGSAAGFIADIIKAVPTTVANWAKNWIKNLAGNADAGGSAANPKGSGVMRWKPYVIKALKANKFEATPYQVNAWLKVIARESGGNPLAVNNWDSNAKAGIPSKGLVQTIGPTFNAFKFKGHGNILNGYDNLLAGINYMAHRYGRGTSAFARVSGPMGYANGGLVTQHQLAEIGEGNKPEMIIPLDPNKRGLGWKYLNQVYQHFTGSEGRPTQQNSGADYSTIFSQMLEQLQAMNDRLQRVEQAQYATALTATDVYNANKQVAYQKQRIRNTAFD